MIINGVSKNKTIDSKFLQDAIYLVKEYYTFPQSSIELAHAVSIEFDCKCTKENIEDYFVDKRYNLMEEEDKRIMYEHVT